MPTTDAIDNIRRDYGKQCIDLALAERGPDALFERWFEENLGTDDVEPTAMVLSTVDKAGLPDSRVVLLKGLCEGKFIFYTNYDSEKGSQLSNRAFAALNFYWPSHARQVRIRGSVEKRSSADSDQYFHQRPHASQAAAIVSKQSTPIISFDAMEQAYQRFLLEHPSGQPLERPPGWGGYELSPDSYEFWQGRDNRLHQRIKYAVQDDNWHFVFLAP